MDCPYSFSEQTTIFANYSAGFKKPTSTNFTQNRDLKPETIDSYELGLRGRPVSWFHYNTALFLIDTKDKVIRTTATVPFLYDNAGKTRSYGVEFGAGIDLDNGLYASVNYTYQKSEYKEYTVEKAAFRTMERNCHGFPTISSAPPWDTATRFWAISVWC